MAGSMSKLVTRMAAEKVKAAGGGLPPDFYRTYYYTPCTVVK